MKRFLLVIIALLFLSGCALQRGAEDNTVAEAVTDDFENEVLPEIKVSESGDYILKSEMQQNPYDTLCVPTQFTKIGEDYFIVDCYHNQILVSDESDRPLKEWRQMCTAIDKGHTIAGDGVIYLCDDTENNRVLVYVKEAETFYQTQQFEDIGVRPHYCLYDETNRRFLVLSSLTGEIYIFTRKWETAEVELTQKIAIPELKDIYVRSFSVIDGEAYFPAGDGYIYVTDIKDFAVKKKVPLAPELGGPVQITKIGEYYYLTVSTDIVGFNTAANIVRGLSPEDFGGTAYESVRERFCDNGTPYVITQVEDCYYLTLHSENGYDCLWRFETDAIGEMTLIERVFDK